MTNNELDLGTSLQTKWNKGFKGSRKRPRRFLDTAQPNCENAFSTDFHTPSFFWNSTIGYGLRRWRINDADLTTGHIDSPENTTPCTIY
jgi:hypothetical protein